MPPPYSLNQLQTRGQQLAKLDDSSEVWDVIVIGGGASGLGIALEAASKNYKTLLLEQADFAKGTSSKSTKLVHGGVRYLNQGNIKLVREATVERGLLYKNAPHLVRNQEFIIPVYSTWDHWKYTVGLTLYDWLSGRLSLGKSYGISRSETLKRLPGIKPDKLAGGVVYHDGQFDDARLAISLVQSIMCYGGFALNYVKVAGLLKHGDKLSGVVARDEMTGKEFSINGKAVINATGVFVDEILQMDDIRKAKSITASQGVHLVIDRSFYASDNAMMIPKTSDGRVLFAVPWHNKVLLGTTDTPVDTITNEPRALQKEVDFILETAAGYLSKRPAAGDVLSVFAGLRPLAASQDGSKKTKEISRSHKMLVSPSNLFTIIGGKWTTYRKMGEDLIRTVEKSLGWKLKPSVTSSIHIYGYNYQINFNDPLYTYGLHADDIRLLVDAAPGEWISTTLNIHKAQVLWAVRHELAETIEDVLSRRTRVLLLNAREAIRIAPAVAKIMADEMQKNDQWQQQQVSDFTTLAQGYLL